MYPNYKTQDKLENLLKNLLKIIEKTLYAWKCFSIVVKFNAQYVRGSKPMPTASFSSLN